MFLLIFYFLFFLVGVILGSVNLLIIFGFLFLIYELIKGLIDLYEFLKIKLLDVNVNLDLLFSLMNFLFLLLVCY